MSNKSKASMNKELQDWVQQSQDKIKKVKGEKKKLKPHGMCQICGERKARFVCIKCGRSVCSSCYFKIIGVCKKCIPPEVAGKWDGSHPDWEKELGVEWVG
jgi:hypothetical protein